MKYLKTVILENFQSHKHTVIDFNEGLNVIVGPSDTGKSAVIRGIRWALYNEPSGDYFIRQGENDASVTLIFNDNTKIKRYRSKSKNQYIVYNSIGEEIKYEGFGLGVPEEIIEKIGIKKIYLDSEETNSINLGEQLEGPFLLSEKTSTRASAIGRLIGVNLIDDALKDTLKDLRNANAQKKNKDANISSLKEELESFEYLKDLNLNLKTLEIIKENIKINEKNKEKLSKLRAKYEEYKKEITSLNFYLSSLNKIEELENNIKDIDDLNRNYKYLNNRNREFKYCVDQINENKTLLNKLSGIDRLIKIQNDLFDRVTLDSKLNKLSSNLKFVNSNKKDINNTLDKLKNMEEVQNKIHELKDKINYLNNLSLLKDRYISNKNSIKKGEKYTSNFKDISKIDSYYRLLEKDINNLILLYDKKKVLDMQKKNLLNEKKKYKEISSKIEDSLKRYKDLLKKQEVCPLCLSTIDDERVNHIMEHFN